MRKMLLTLSMVVLTLSLGAQEHTSIVLNPPDMTRGFPVMKAFSFRSSVNEFDTAELTLRDLSDLLWAANGINRPESGKRTAPSAQNAQDIDVYVFMRSGIYLYDAKKHQLDLINNRDYRDLLAGKQTFVAKAPVIFLLVSDISKFRHGEDSLKVIFGAEDAGIVSQNISIFCASANLATRPRGSMDRQRLREVLDLKQSQQLMLNHPVSYKRK